MFDIDKELSSLKTQCFRPSEELRLDTRALVKNAAVRQHVKKPAAAFRPAYAAAVAAVLVIAMLISVFTAAPAQAAGYYTIDINPSISAAVDLNGNVISVTAENEDAKELLSGLGLKGMRFEDALEVIIQAAVQKQYLTDNGHVLVAHFGDGGGLTQQQLNSIVGRQAPGNSVSALILSGEKAEFENAEKAGQKPGVELLRSSAKQMGIENEDLGALIRMMSDKDNGGKNKDEQSGNGQDKKTPDVTAAPGSGENNPGNKNGDKQQQESGSGNSGSPQGGGNGTQETGQDKQDKEQKDKSDQGSDKQYKDNNANSPVNEKDGGNGQDKDKVSKE